MTFDRELRSGHSLFQLLPVSHDRQLFEGVAHRSFPFPLSMVAGWTASRTTTTMAPSLRLLSSEYLIALLLAAAILLLHCPLSCDAFWSAAEEEEEQQQPPQPHRPQADEVPVEYGVDVSFPMHHSKTSDNYAWLPHNMDPSLPVPERYKGMAVQPLGNRQYVVVIIISALRIWLVAR
jgi:hypothetical protein